MYIGNGEVIDVHGPKDQVNSAAEKFPMDKYLARYKHIKKAPIN